MSKGGTVRCSGMNTKRCTSGSSELFMDIIRTLGKYMSNMKLIYEINLKYRFIYNDKMAVRSDVMQYDQADVDLEEKACETIRTIMERLCEITSNGGLLYSVELELAYVREDYTSVTYDMHEMEKQMITDDGEEDDEEDEDDE